VVHVANSTALLNDSVSVPVPAVCPLTARSHFFLHFGAVNKFFLLTYLKLVGTDAKCLSA